MRWDLHTHYYPEAFFRLIEEVGGAFSFGTDPTGRTIIRYRGSRFFGITPPMTDPVRRIQDMDRVGIDVEVLSVLLISGAFIWPVWVRSHARTAKERQQMMKRYTREILRLTLHGTLRPEKYRELDELINKPPRASKAAANKAAANKAAATTAAASKAAASKAPASKAAATKPARAPKARAAKSPTPRA